MTPLEVAYAAHASVPKPGRLALASDSAAVWERAWKDETWWRDGEHTGGLS